MNVTKLTSALLLLTAVACKENPRPVRVDPPKAAKKLDDKTAKEISKTVGQLLEAEPEKLSDADRKAAADASKLHGEWQIRHTIMRTNGKSSGPSKPLVPTRWSFDEKGRLKVVGGMKIDGAYVYTGEKLIITGLGPKQTYTVDALSETELKVTARIEAGSVLIENTTVLERI